MDWLLLPQIKGGYPSRILSFSCLSFVDFVFNGTNQSSIPSWFCLSKKNPSFFLHRPFRIPAASFHLPIRTLSLFPISFFFHAFNVPFLICFLLLFSFVPYSHRNITIATIYLALLFLSIHKISMRVKAMDWDGLSVLIEEYLGYRRMPEAQKERGWGVGGKMERSRLTSE